jgi:hypothetical protein
MLGVREDKRPAQDWGVFRFPLLKWLAWSWSTWKRRYWRKGMSVCGPRRCATRASANRIATEAMTLNTGRAAAKEAKLPMAEAAAFQTGLKRSILTSLSGGIQSFGLPPERGVEVRRCLKERSRPARCSVLLAISTNSAFSLHLKRGTALEYGSTLCELNLRKPCAQILSEIVKSMHEMCEGSEDYPSQTIPLLARISLRSRTLISS